MAECLEQCLGPEMFDFLDKVSHDPHYRKWLGLKNNNAQAARADVLRAAGLDVNHLPANPDVATRALVLAEAYGKTQDFFRRVMVTVASDPKGSRQLPGGWNWYVHLSQLKKNYGHALDSVLNDRILTAPSAFIHKVLYESGFQYKDLRECLRYFFSNIAKEVKTYATKQGGWPRVAPRASAWYQPNRKQVIAGRRTIGTYRQELFCDAVSILETYLPRLCDREHRRKWHADKAIHVATAVVNLQTIIDTLDTLPSNAKAQLNVADALLEVARRRLDPQGNNVRLLTALWQTTQNCAELLVGDMQNKDKLLNVIVAKHNVERRQAQEWLRQFKNGRSFKAASNAMKTDFIERGWKKKIRTEALKMFS